MNADSPRQEHLGAAGAIALGGALAPAAAALAAQWTAHIALPRVPFAPYSVGQWIIRHTPGGLATTAIDDLGRWALRILALVTIAGALALGLVLRRLPSALLGVVAFVSTLGAAVLDPSHPSLRWAVVGGAAAGLVAALVAAALARPSRRAVAFDEGRRRLIAGLAAGLGMLALGGAAVWRSLRSVVPGLVEAARPLVVHSSPAFDRIAGLSPLVTSREDHYIVDIDLVDPMVAAEGWRLRVDGGTGRSLALSLNDLLAMPTVERLVCMSCISNPVGGALVSDSTWTGVPVKDLLAHTGVSGGAPTLLARGADGYFETIPLAAAMAPTVLVAVAMDGSLLPREHGFPARLLVPGRYGYKSVKWLQSLTAEAGHPSGYWVERGWDPNGEIRTESRIDVPADHSPVPRRFTVAGVAWAGDRGISRVEVSPDDGGTWMRAELEPVVDPLSWRRWRLALSLPAGVHSLTVRATDRAGAIQSASSLPPHPSGASGYHRIVISAAE